MSILITEDGSSSCMIISTLVKVTELFLNSVNNLKQIDSKRMEELKSVMENYERINMVVRVMKLAYPTCNDAHRQVLDSTVKIVDAVAIDNLSSIQDHNIQNNTNNMVTPLQQQQQQTQQPSQQLEPVVVQHQINQRELSPVTKTEPITNGHVHPIDTSPQQQQAPVPITPITATYHQHISPKEFLDGFENTAKAFAAQNGFLVATIWESLFPHALPEDKLQWAQNNVLNRNYTWSQAREIYLKAFPGHQTLFQKFPERQVPNSNKRIHSRHARTHDPLPTPPPTDMEEMQILRKRQEKYAEHFLALEMKEYETIRDYNKKFIRYTKIANIGLSQVDLIRRYLNSLLSKHKEVMQSVLQSPQTSQPKDINQMTALTEKVIESQRLVKERIYAQNCWKHSNTISKRPSYNEERPAKRFSSCA